MREIWHRVVDWVLSIGAYPGESEVQRGKRRIFVVAALLASTLSIPNALEYFASGYTWIAVADAVVIVAGYLSVVVIALRPNWFARLVTVVFVLITVLSLIDTTMLGGLYGSSLAAVFELQVVLGALILISLRAAMFWFGVFVASVVYAVVIPSFIEPLYTVSDPTPHAAFQLVAVSAVVVAVLLYFVRQRDRFQRQSDDLLHNILPDEIATRLKTGPGMIADAFPEASVLFADVVGFTPMSAGMSPPELVGLLDRVFTAFDRFVAELGLEKIKTVGDEYMVAAGVPRVRPDHAQAIAELALRIRDHLAATEFDGHRLALRIGIHSGPVVAGIIGTHKFAYDMWGDTVNIASRMESEGIPGQIQVSAATRRALDGAGFTLEPRGVIPVKGRGEMETFLLVGRA